MAATRRKAPIHRDQFGRPARFIVSWASYYGPDIFATSDAETAMRLVTRFARGPVCDPTVQVHRKSGAAWSPMVQ